MEDLIERIDRITAILRLAHSEALKRASSTVRSEPAKAAILEIVGSDWIGTRVLQQRAAAKIKASERTVRDHLGELVDMGILQKRGEARNTEYRDAGVI